MLVVLAILFVLNRLNQQKITAQADELAVSEGRTILDLIRITGEQLASEGEPRLTGFLDNLFSDDNIIYIGLMKDQQLDYLQSRYEGYFPVLPDQAPVVILDSPVGKILNVQGEFTGPEGHRHQLFIGFDYAFQNYFEKTASRNYLIVFFSFFLLSVGMVSVIIFLDRRFANKQRELELEKQQKDHFKNLSLLTAQIAHEIKNPLNSIYLSFQNLEKYFQPDESAEFYRKAIRGEIKRINNIIQTYTGFRQEPEIRVSAVNLKNFFKDLEILFREELDASRATLSLDIPGDITCQSDPDLLKQIFINLISNGIQAKGKSISIAVSRIAGKIHVILTDDGVGFEPKIREHVFEPFQSGKRSGMGIGLYIVRKLVAALGGDIQLSSWESGHTRFDIYFPDGETDE